MVLCDDLEGWGRSWGGKEAQEEGNLYVYLPLIHVVVQQKPIQHCKAIIFSVQLLSHARLFATPWTAACHASLSITHSWSLLKLMANKSVMPSNHLILCCPLLLLLAIFPSIRAFSNESVLCIRWPKYWSYSFSISPSNEYSGLISFRMDWLDLPVVQRALRSLLQYHSSEASILRGSVFFTVQLLLSIHDHWKNHSFD